MNTDMPRNPEMKTCRVCGRSAIRLWLDFGPQAIRNRFVTTVEEREYRHGLRLGVCRACGTVQLEKPPPVGELRPRFGWITYNEPEQHLDDVAAALAGLPGITPLSRFAGLTYKDDSILARLNRLGFVNNWRPEMKADLGIDEPHSGIESIQARLIPETAETLAATFGSPDVLIVRHVLEHTHDTRTALGFAAKLVRSDGYIVFEVPDAVRALNRRDYTTIWEEHVLYFTSTTLRHCLEHAGNEVLSLESYPFTLEDSLIAIVRPSGKKVEHTVDPVEAARAECFIRDFPLVRELTSRQLEDRGRVAMLGAGHLSGAFLNLYRLADRVEFVVDDSPHKQGRFMPGTRLPILPSEELVSRDIDLCLMTVRPEIEDAVVARNAAFTTKGGMLASVFPDSPYSIDRVRQRAGEHDFNHARAKSRRFRRHRAFLGITHGDLM